MYITCGTKEIDEICVSSGSKLTRMVTAIGKSAGLDYEPDYE